MDVWLIDSDISIPTGRAHLPIPLERSPDFFSLQNRYLTPLGFMVGLFGGLLDISGTVGWS